MKLKSLALLVTTSAFIFLSGCASPPADPHLFVNTYEGMVMPPLRVPDEKIYTVKGSAFLKQRNGETRDCSGSTVYLTQLPEKKGAYEREYDSLSSRVAAASTIDGRFLADLEKRKLLLFGDSLPCDVDGRFEFENIAPGHYKVSTNITWSYVGTCGYGDYKHACTKSTGGRASKVVVVKDNPDKRVYKLVVTR